MKSILVFTTFWVFFVTPSLSHAADNFHTLRGLMASLPTQDNSPATDDASAPRAVDADSGEERLGQLERDFFGDLDSGSKNSSAQDGENKTKPRANRAVTWNRKPITELRMDIREFHAAAPKDRSQELNYGMGDWTQFYATPKVFAWAAPDIRYQPLYFEDVALERYGQTLDCNTLACNARPWRDLQPWRSGYHFFKSALLLPHQMWHQPAKSCDYPLGFCRPGTCTPQTKSVQFYGLWWR